MQHSAALVHLPPPGEAKRKLYVEPLLAAPGSKAITDGGDEPSARSETLETEATETLETEATSSSEPSDASGSRAAALSGQEPLGGAGAGGAGLTVQAGRMHDAKTGECAASVRGGEQSLSFSLSFSLGKGGMPKSDAHGVVIDEAIDHERFTQLAKQQPGWAPAPDGSQHLPLMSPAPDLAQVGPGLHTSLRRCVSCARSHAQRPWHDVVGGL